MKTKLIEAAKLLWLNHAYTFHMGTKESTKYYRIANILFHRYGLSRQRIGVYWKQQIDFI